EFARVCKAWARVTGRLLALARIRVPRLSPIGNRRNRPAAAKNAANFFRSSTRAAGGNHPGIPPDDSRQEANITHFMDCSEAQMIGDLIGSWAATISDESG